MKAAGVFSGQSRELRKARAVPFCFSRDDCTGYAAHCNCFFMIYSKYAAGCDF